MGRATVIGGGEDGLYQVRLAYDIQRALQLKAELEQKLDVINVDITEAGLQVNMARERLEAAAANLDALIPSYVENPEEHVEELGRRQVDLVNARSDLARENRALEQLKSERLAAQKKIDQIERIPETRVVAAWCADYTDDLEGQVGTIEIGDEGGNAVLVRPGYEGAAQYEPARDGVLVPRAAQNPNQVYFNAAVLPGVQRWLPGHRIATITSLTGDECSIALEPCESSAQNLDINPGNTYSGVPITYMQCNGGAFEEGDRVVVAFEPGEEGAPAPRVIGFENNPRPCDLNVYIQGLYPNPGGGGVNIILEMSPDLLEIVETHVARKYKISGQPFFYMTSLAVTNKAIAYTHKYTDQEDSVYIDTLIFNNGVEYASEGEARSWVAVGANSSIYGAVYSDGNSENSRLRVFNADAQQVGSFDITFGGQIDFSISTVGPPAMNDQFAFLVGLNMGSGLYQGNLLDLTSGGRRWSTPPIAGSGYPNCITANRVYTHNQPFDDSFNIYDMAGALVGTWPTLPGTNVRGATVTANKGYVFRQIAVGDFEHAIADIYSRDGDTFTFIKSVNLTLEHQVTRVDGAAVDQAMNLKMTAKRAASHS